MRGGYASCPNGTLVRPPFIPWEEAPAGPDKTGKLHIEESNGKVQRGVEEGHYDIWEMRVGLAKRYDGGPPVEEDSKRKSGIE